MSENQIEIKAMYDQSFSRAIRDVNGKVVAHEPTTHHYTFGSVGSELSGGFYIKAGSELPKAIKLTAKPQVVMLEVPALEINIKYKD